MVAVKGAEADRTLRRRGEHAAILVFGPDAGLVSERVGTYVTACIGEPADPLGIVRLEGDEVASDPDRLLDEAYASSLFGGARVVRLRLGSRAVHGVFEKLLAGPPPEAGIIIEGGDLKKSHPLRALFEKARNGAAIACYADGAADIARLIEGELAAAGLRIAPDARAALVDLLGADRLASRQELHKLALYAHGMAEVDFAAVTAVVADASASAADEVVDCAFTGAADRLDAALTTAFAAGVSTQALLSAALRQSLRLLALRNGGGPGQSAFGMPPHRRAAQEEALRRWSPAALEGAMHRIADAVLASRRNADLAETIVGRTLLALAISARGRR